MRLKNHAVVYMYIWEQKTWLQFDSNIEKYRNMEKRKHVLERLSEMIMAYVFEWKVNYSSPCPHKKPPGETLSYNQTMKILDCNFKNLPEHKKRDPKGESKQ
jgi:hypothetical protein